MYSALWSKFDVYSYESFIVFHILVNECNVAKLQMALRYLYGYNTSLSEICFNQKNCTILIWKTVYFL